MSPLLTQFSPFIALAVDLLNSIQGSQHFGRVSDSIILQCFDNYVFFHSQRFQYSKTKTPDSSRTLIKCKPHPDIWVYKRVISHNFSIQENF